MEKGNLRRSIQTFIAAGLILLLMQLLVSCKMPEAPPVPSPTPFVPNIDAFTVGTIDDTGYASTFFGFGIYRPKFWGYYRRSDIDSLNQIQNNADDLDAYDQEMIDRIKNGDAPYEYFAGNDSNGESITIYVKDYAGYSDFTMIEYAVLNDMQGWLYDSNADSQEDIGNLKLDVVDLLGVEHPVYRYDNLNDGYGNRGAFLAIKQGTTFALILVNGEDDNAVNKILQNFYTPNAATQGN